MKMPRGKWLCVTCAARTPTKKKSSKKKTASPACNNNNSDNGGGASATGAASGTSSAAGAVGGTANTAAANCVAGGTSSAFPPVNDSIYTFSENSPKSLSGDDATDAKPSSKSRSSASGAAGGRSSKKMHKKEKEMLVRELAPCRTVLDELEVHEDSWPFLVPVNTKQFPTYKKIIKNPMDLQTIRKRLDSTSKDQTSAKKMNCRKL
ncbi:unnamed protein product [Notodromas monacha]|uniref:Bromo domain-containing protein n=1 Tax=Notodromas monacha TaxID=399045 RepID=A0A7R9BL91_9CRUS|nr:unnamed protein product [Notodromas monacha]CAG0916197.1 unnamed protein product [Notodromas monacha]